MTRRGEGTDKRGDRRVGKTRRALKKALTDLLREKPYESVTVQHIIDRADVGRSTFYSHFLDKDDLMVAVFRDLEMPPPHQSSWTRSDPPFAWTPQLFAHMREAAPLFKAAASSESASIPRRETLAWLEGLVRAELARVEADTRIDNAKFEMLVRFLTGTFIGVADWWARPENQEVPIDAVDAGFRSLVLPGVGNVLGLEIDYPRAI